MSYRFIIYLAIVICSYVMAMRFLIKERIAHPSKEERMENQSEVLMVTTTGLLLMFVVQGIRFIDLF